VEKLESLWSKNAFHLKRVQFERNIENFQVSLVSDEDHIEE
jgi:hypothetical protein